MNYTIVQLVDLLKTGAITSLALVKNYISKVDTYADETVFTQKTHGLALEQAKASDERRQKGASLSLLDGIPMVWKDNIDITHYHTSAGLMYDNPLPAKTHSAIYQSALSLGMVCLGKTTLNEIAFSGLGINPKLGTPKNVFGRDRHHIPGGSSSGSAVAVAVGLAPAAIGTDTGGSVRIPAAWNGLVGLKTTQGLISTKGIVALSNTLDTIGFLTQDVTDASILHEHLGERKTEITQMKKIRLGLLKNIVFGDIDAAVQKVFDRAIQKISESGIEVSAIKISQIDEVFNISASEGNIIAYEAFQNWGELIKQSPEIISENIKRRILAGEDLTSDKIEEVSKKIEVLKSRYLEKTYAFDGIIMPTIVIQPPLLSDFKNNGQFFDKTNALVLRNTRVANLLGLCSITIPVGNTPDGFPVGLMINAGPNEEHQLLAVSFVLEEIFSGK